MRTQYFGWGKFLDVDKNYFESLEAILQLDIDKKDFIFQFPVFTGHVNLGRYLFFYDLYKKVLNLNGHLADVGTYKGASFLYMAKLVKLFEPYNTTQVHGFDWFEGMKPSEKDDPGQENKYKADYEILQKLIRWQNLNDVAILNKMDITKELDNYFELNSHLRFKMVFIDCGISEVLQKSLEHFWSRLVKGGVLIMDHYNCEVSPSESDLLEQYIGNNYVLQMPFNRQPTCYVVKQ
ncbi:MAG: hypothetical protein A4E53_02129 [Pelotomaculum sp. PtaB.Bin104]|nr:MAG: hypothetical protein A4E53_02129 [Pelotomaculum sp. PtaB.Bin104]